MGAFDDIANLLGGKNEDSSPTRIKTDSPIKKSEIFSRRHIEDTILFVDNDMGFQKEMLAELKKTGYSVEFYLGIPDTDKLAMSYSAAILEIDFDYNILRGPQFYNILVDSHLVKNFVFVTKANPLGLIYWKGGYESHPCYRRVINFKNQVESKGDVFIYKNPLFWDFKDKNTPLPELVVKLMYQHQFLEKK